jgi:phosphoglycerate dehydrogenase-like enzyme
VPAAERPRVVTPYEFADLADALELIPWDGTGPLPDEAAEAQVYVMPYVFNQPTLDVIAAMPKLEVIQTQTAGVEHVLPYLRKGIVLCNARGVHDASTAELAVTLTLASLRGLRDFVTAQAGGQWAFAVRDSLADRRVLIVGYGSIGAALEQRLLPFECDVVRVARQARENVYEMGQLPDLLPEADVVVLLIPLTDETRKLVNAEFLGRMKDGALLVNVARGAIVDTEALLAEVQTARLRAALDVTDPEPLPTDHPLWRAPGVLITPHVGGASSAFLPRSKRLIHEQLKRYAAGRPLLNVMSGEY